MSALIFDQSDLWVADGGREVRVSDIDPDYARNILAFLEARADAYKEQYEYAIALLPGPSGDMANDAFDAEYDRLLAMPALDWLRGTRLYRAIAERAA